MFALSYGPILFVLPALMFSQWRPFGLWHLAFLLCCIIGAKVLGLELAPSHEWWLAATIRPLPRCDHHGPHVGRQ
jgi:hypothetical protein